MIKEIKIKGVCEIANDNAYIVSSEQSKEQLNLEALVNE